jgi:hypothetical protein
VSPEPETGRPTQVVLTDEGPLLLSGPFELVMPDGTKLRPRRQVTALCTCRRSRRPPFCDASHRARQRPEAGGGQQC